MREVPKVHGLLASETLESLVFKAHRLFVSLNSRLESNKEEKRNFGAADRAEVVGDHVPHAPRLVLLQLPDDRAAANIARSETGILLPNNQRQHRTLHIQKDVLPYAWCWLLCPESAALAIATSRKTIRAAFTTP